VLLHHCCSLLLLPEEIHHQLDGSVASNCILTFKVDGDFKIKHEFEKKQNSNVVFYD